MLITAYQNFRGLGRDWSGMLESVLAVDAID